MIITNERVARVGYFITSYPTRAHGIIVIYSVKFMSRLMFPQLQDSVKYKMASVLLHLFISIIADGIAMIFMQDTIFTIYF